MPVESIGGPEELATILASLSLEICRPLDLLRDDIDRLVNQPARPLTEVERSQALTMLTLCDDLGRLTRECLGVVDPLKRSTEGC